MSPNLAAAVPLTPTPNHPVTIAQNAVEETVIQGNGVEFTVPTGFQGGSPSDSETKTLIRGTAKMFPSMAPFVEVIDRDPGMIRAIAMNANRADTSVVLVMRLPVPAEMSLDYLQQSMAQMLPGMLPEGFKLVGNRVVTVGNRQIVKMDVVANLQGTKIKESIGLIREGNEIYQVTYVFENKNTNRARSTFDRLIRSFKTTSTTSAQSPAL